MRMWSLFGLIVLLTGCYANEPETPRHRGGRHRRVKVARQTQTTTVSGYAPVQGGGVCGDWESLTSRKTYRFLCHENASFDVLEVNGAQANLIGNGKRTSDFAAAMGTFDVRGTPRQAILRFHLENADTLTGTFVGEDPQEFGSLKFARRTPAAVPAPAAVPTPGGTGTQEPDGDEPEEP